MAEPSDSEVIRRSWADPEVFETIFDRHYRGVYRYLVVRVGLDAAEDLSSEVFTRAFALRRRYRLEFHSARPWLYGIAANLVRQRSRGLRYRSQKLQRLQGRVRAEADDDTEEVLERVEAQLHFGEALAPALEHLADGEREVLALHVGAELTQREVAESLGVPVGTVKSRLFRALAKLREHLGTSGESTSQNPPPRSRHG